VKFNNETYANKIQFNWLDKLVDSFVVKKRNDMWKNVVNSNDTLNYLELNNVKNCLDVGTTSDEHYESSNFFLRKLPRNVEISTFSNQKISNFFKVDFPPIFKSYEGSICSQLKIEEKFNLVICSATLEHVGSFENQKLAIANLIELTDKYLFITVPNRWHPIEFHSRLPLVHWLPKKVWRKIFRQFRSLENLSIEDNLNFISPKIIKAIILENRLVKEVKVHRTSLFGFNSNFAILVIVDN
jgi:hypothetical protein